MIDYFKVAGVFTEDKSIDDDIDPTSAPATPTRSMSRL